MSDVDQRPKRNRKPTQKVVESENKVPEDEATVKAVASLLIEDNSRGRLQYLCNLFGVTRQTARRRMSEVCELRDMNPWQYGNVRDAAAEMLAEREAEAEKAEKEKYRDCTDQWRYARELLRKKTPYVDVQTRIQRRFKTDVSINQLRRVARKQPPTVKMGAPPKVPIEYERRIVFAITQLVEFGYIVYPDAVKDMANRAIAGTHVQRLFKGGVVSSYWYYSFLTRNNLVSTIGRATDLKRMQADHAENFKRYYKQVAAILLKYGYAVKNTNPETMDSEPITLVKAFLHKIFEIDETMLDPSKAMSRSNVLKQIVPRGFDAQVLVDKSNPIRISGMGGVCADGSPMRPAFCVNSGEGIDPEELEDLDLHVVGNGGEQLDAVIYSNEHGSFKVEQLIMYFRAQTHMLATATAEQPLIGILDGVQTHIQEEFVDYCRENHIEILVKPPHTTHRLQGLDLPGQQFSTFKKQFHLAIQDLLRSRRQHCLRAFANGVYNVSPSLSVRNVLECVKGPWETVFNNRKMGLKGWASMGISPFTRCVYHSAKRREERAKRSRKRKRDNDDLEFESNLIGVVQQTVAPVVGVSAETISTMSKQKRSRISSSTVSRQFDGLATGDNYRQALEEKRAQQAEAEAAKAARAAAHQQKQQELLVERQQICETVWKKLECNQGNVHYSKLTIKQLQAILQCRLSMPWDQVRRLKRKQNLVEAVGIELAKMCAVVDADGQMRASV